VQSLKTHPTSTATWLPYVKHGYRASLTHDIETGQGNYTHSVEAQAPALQVQNKKPTKRRRHHTSISINPPHSNTRATTAKQKNKASGAATEIHPKTPPNPTLELKY